jgi:hypothetical protein
MFCVSKVSNLPIVRLLRRDERRSVCHRRRGRQMPEVHRVAPRVLLRRCLKDREGEESAAGSQGEGCGFERGRRDFDGKGDTGRGRPKEK